MQLVKGEKSRFSRKYQLINNIYLIFQKHFALYKEIFRIILILAHNALAQLISSVATCELDFALRLELKKIIASIAAPGKGLLACDETSTNMDEKFREIGTENTETKRREYREMLLSANKVAM